MWQHIHFSKRIHPWKTPSMGCWATKKWNNLSQINATAFTLFVAYELATGQILMKCKIDVSFLLGHKHPVVSVYQVPESKWIQTEPDFLFVYVWTEWLFCTLQTHTLYNNIQFIVQWCSVTAQLFWHNGIDLMHIELFYANFIHCCYCCHHYKLAMIHQNLKMQDVS